ncbi:hypothetical protein H8356DRAFT_1625803 [Neocallimastix lanati (nom. inval.)]|jgi:hypothetical protein|uniref:BLUF domain-containing protein n=1 Tax=Neocallimastix californiae TaxID=1754190 RepID=A0A1Y2AFI7_9FUNG|nr:hypothetical protein H8356DRAFT_1625803 [Neocallimastix sp. JGI-2020a]ORY21030.1 hypothetical protein LY90DRAFT_676467 [Neocallimastix californiae]|eukprot:ORY21030.1 hypothetical protein LY90DRAFT_676467 [Neocallimastix californiae]
MVSDNSNNKNSQNKAPSENDKRSLAITDIDIDEKRLNYLDIIRENTNHNRKEILCRTVICGKVNSYDNLTEEEKSKIIQPDLGVYYANIIKKHQNTDSIITGLFLYSDRVFIHFLEASQKITNLINNDIKDNILIDTDSIRYLYYNDYIENRSFPFWINRSLPKLDKIYIDDELTDEHIDETVFNLIKNLVSLGETLSTITKDEIKVTLEELGTKHSDYIPSATQLEQFMKPDVNIISFNEWNTIFSPDYNLVLESDLVWPESESLIF